MTQTSQPKAHASVLPNISVLDRRRFAYAFLFFLSLAALSVITAAWGASKKFEPGSDADQYLAIARSLAAGNGYKNLVGPFRTLPDYSRMPAWPTMLAVALRVAPGVAPELVDRCLNAVCLALAGVFFCALTHLLGVRLALAIPAGLAISLSPTLVYLCVDGMTEVPFVMTIAVGITAILVGGRSLYLGAAILGFAPLFRPNFVLFCPVFLVSTLFFRPARRWLLQNLARTSLCCVLALAPSLLWTARNYSLTGRFPLLSSMEGETLYGANNEVVANSLRFWGYWVMPNDIPGETPKAELAKSLGSDLALNDYYHAKAVSWMNSNRSALPRLELGKFIRAFVPIPWVPLWQSDVAFFCRFLLYAFCFGLIAFWKPTLNRAYLLICLAIAIVHISTTAVYYGIFRFTHCFVEIFMVPCIAYALDQWWTSRALSRTIDRHQEA